jgi:exopolysaccharide production protein ExoY
VELARDWRRSPEPPAETTATEAPPARPRGRADARAVAARAADVLCALTLMVVASPLILLGAAAVFAVGGRPIFFGHVRVGRDGRLFRCWKLRTMHADAESRLRGDDELHQRYLRNGYKLPSSEDPRVLPAGRWLRRTYVDELPQLWNVLRGDMSLVGPRPLVPREVELFGEHAPVLLTRRPGVFGEWTSRGRARPPYPERVRVEMLYVNDPSVARSLRILLRSVWTVFWGQGPNG